MYVNKATYTNKDGYLKRYARKHAYEHDFGNN